MTLTREGEAPELFALARVSTGPLGEMILWTLGGAKIVLEPDEVDWLKKTLKR